MLTKATAKGNPSATPSTPAMTTQPKQQKGPSYQSDFVLVTKALRERNLTLTEFTHYYINRAIIFADTYGKQLIEVLIVWARCIDCPKPDAQILHNISEHSYEGRAECAQKAIEEVKPEDLFGPAFA